MYLVLPVSMAVVMSKSIVLYWYPTLIARFMGPTWGPSGADRTQVGPMLAPWTLLSGLQLSYRLWNRKCSSVFWHNPGIHTPHKVQRYPYFGDSTSISHLFLLWHGKPNNGRSHYVIIGPKCYRDVKMMLSLHYWVSAIMTQQNYN